MERGQVYKCTGSGVVIEVLDQGQLEKPCTEQDMRPLLERTAAEEGKEKHVPVVEQTSEGIHVKVGSVPHPMEPDHWIKWIELRTSDKCYRHWLKPGEQPETTFPLVEGEFAIREHCNKHGLWKA